MQIIASREWVGCANGLPAYRNKETFRELCKGILRCSLGRFLSSCSYCDDQNLRACPTKLRTAISSVLLLSNFNLISDTAVKVDRRTALFIWLIVGKKKINFQKILIIFQVTFTIASSSLLSVHGFCVNQFVIKI